MAKDSPCGYWSGRGIVRTPAVTCTITDGTLSWQRILLPTTVQVDQRLPKDIARYDDDGNRCYLLLYRVVGQLSRSGTQRCELHRHAPHSAESQADARAWNDHQHKI